MTEFVTQRQAGVTIHVLPTDQFKVNTIVVNFHRPLYESMATGTALVPYLLMRGTKTYRDAQALQTALDDLYGAAINGYIVKKGERQIVEFVLQVPNEQFLNANEPLLDQALSVLQEILFHPRLDANAFPKDQVEKEKALHKERILSIIDDKIAYASERCLETMCKDEPFGVPRLGTVEQLEKLTHEELYQTYTQVLQASDIHVYVIGQLDPDTMFKKIGDVFQQNPFANRKPDFPSIQIRSKRSEVQTIVEHMDVNQGKLNIGYRTGTTHGDELYPAMIVYNGILGGFPHSKLFINVREKASLAYYASSRLESLKGILYVQSGIEIQNYEKALSIIQQQFEEMKTGNISEQEFAFTRDGLLNQYRTLQDQPVNIADLYTNGVVSGTTRTIAEMMEAIQHVTVEQVVQFAQRVQLDTVYFLRDQEVRQDG
ncbi:insulinase family protein [Fodinisporobacter ferrooxydans]|uniref:Insulinase family protein n=1 Tax=Fodinisporobacter ferrooxydans TaxID=2901836 RepID=A0ABY4CJC4_9BACL|nr:insulinase family protein [Alicyclobacillaceae bacterium MYW30-H2]